MLYEEAHLVPGWTFGAPQVKATYFILLDGKQSWLFFVPLSVVAERKPPFRSDQRQPFVIWRLWREAVSWAVMKFDMKWRVCSLKRFWKAFAEVSVKIERQFIHVLFSTGSKGISSN
jgi:hypothetical protein